MHSGLEVPVGPRAVAADQPAGLDRRLLLMHQVMLGDRRRLDAYTQALKQAVAPGDIVVDVGAGSLILSLLALECGARHVYAIEADPQMAALATQIAVDNCLAGRLTVVAGDARTVRLAEQADVLVSEMMGNLGPEEEMAEILQIAARRLLRPGGKVVPQRLTTKLQAIAFDDEGWGVWRKDFRGFSLAAVRDYAQPGAQLHFFSRPPHLLSDALVVADHRLGCSSGQPRGRHELEITRAGQLQALCMYFSTALGDDVELSNFPSYPGCNWAVLVWPLQHTAVACGDVIQIDITPPAMVRFAEQWRLDCRINRQHVKG